mgnify:CR=1 FL=1
MKKHEMIDLQLFADASAALNNTTSTAGMIARPSRPSVRFTAFEKPTIHRYVTNTKPAPNGIATCLNNGT